MGAKILDGLIVGIVFFPPIIYCAIKADPGQQFSAYQVVELLFELLYAAANIGYQIFFVGKYAATPGKMACGLRVVTADGGKVGFGLATGRAFAEMLSGMICYIGYIIIAFDDQKRALHDHICSTRVVYK